MTVAVVAVVADHDVKLFHLHIKGWIYDVVEVFEAVAVAVVVDVSFVGTSVVTDVTVAVVVVAVKLLNLLEFHFPPSRIYPS